MRGWLFFPLWILLFLFSFEASANQCREIFAFLPRAVNDFPINDIFAGQRSVGVDYAKYKALRDAGIDTSTNWSTLTPKQKAKMEGSLKKELAYRVPVFIDPQGRVFSVDQHHDMFGLLLILGKKSNPKIPLTVLRDFSKEPISTEEFKGIVQRNGWINERDMDVVLENPVSIRELSNSIERSVLGMAFVEISSREGISFKGKYFDPFIQFLLADFMKAHDLMEFSATYKDADVQTAVALISKNSQVRTFLRRHLVEEPPKDITKFLED